MRVLARALSLARPSELMLLDAAEKPSGSSLQHPLHVRAAQRLRKAQSPRVGRGAKNVGGAALNEPGSNPVLRRRSAAHGPRRGGGTAVRGRPGGPQAAHNSH